MGQIVNALGGADVRDRFLVPWQAPWRGEQAGGAEPTRGNAAASREGGHPDRDNGISAARIVGRAEQAPKLAQRIWSNEIPTRNRHFTGREAELELIRENISDGISPHMQVIAGMGGIGKTELATEYVHRNIDKYEIIWWIRAEHHDRIREALIKLAQRLELRRA